MYQTFTGSARRPRQVNLSGRKSNPFASPSGDPQSAVASAHSDRVARQQQRAQLDAAKRLQRIWRGHSSRTVVRTQCREQFDKNEGPPSEEASSTPYESEEVCLRQLALIRRIAVNSIHDGDARRLQRLCSRLRLTVTARKVSCTGPWPLAYLRLIETILGVLGARAWADTRVDDELHASLAFLVGQIPERSAPLASSYFRRMATATAHVKSKCSLEATLAPLRFSNARWYTAFALNYLTEPLPLTTLEEVARNVDVEALTVALSSWVQDKRRFIAIVSSLLSILVDQIDVEFEAEALDSVAFDALLRRHRNDGRLNKFLQDQLLSLVNQSTIGSLLTSNTHSQDAQMFAGYALTLLRIFRRKADDICMWLYLGSNEQPGGAIPYFWHAVRESSTFTTITNDSHAVVRLMQPSPPPAMGQRTQWQPPKAPADIANDWRIIFVFMELYGFVLKLMDDEAFLGSENAGRGNPLTLTDIKDLSVFLKHAGFSMYYEASLITQVSRPESDAGNLNFRLGNASSALHATSSDNTRRSPQALHGVGGLVGISFDYARGLVIGLVRQIYERDSRRRFLPKNHWLMTSRFDMTSFIPTVVAEEQARRDRDDSEGNQEEFEGDLFDDEDEEARSYRRNGPSAFGRQPRNRLRETHINTAEQRKRQVAPKLDVLQSMPFVIPFDVRVQVFREFVALDQEKRRNGYTDPDTWRQSLMFRQGPNPQSELQRHHATIRRKHEFEDAFAQFYDLGEGLKEPIQITFEDEFGIQEAGIDGGGVTKEFLMSVVGEAFKLRESSMMGADWGMWCSNTQHQLYPDPTAIQRMRHELKSFGFSDTAPEVRESISDLLQRFEFLGRIVGKCLYEGILIDVGFAGFFLLKWALFGGPGESGYRSNINDLRELDEELYQGLLRLKNYTGDVEELSLTFSVTDTIQSSVGKSIAVDRELIANGSNIPVTNANRLLYIAHLARYRLSTQPYQQTHAFLRGLSSIVNPAWLAMFNQHELQTLVGGEERDIDVENLRRNTIYGGVYQIGDDGLEHPSVRLFWETMHALPDVDRRKVLKFVTSTPRAPLLGFGALNPRFSIRDSGADESRLPTTSTCVNLLKLPRYKSGGVLKKKLLDAVNSGAGFDLS
ncbi:ubiquitin-protein ligase (E3) [Elasticomyces elasticus]|nr:ubiquitin-protein ligase (E3) [Elasticomyces elasticus]